MEDLRGTTIVLELNALEIHMRKGKDLVLNYARLWPRIQSGLEIALFRFEIFQFPQRLFQMKKREI